MSPFERIIAAFDDEFVVQSAETASQITEALRLRHQVYCLERGYETATPAGIEQDDYDRLAYHVIACDRRSGQVMGTLRLIPPDLSVPRHEAMPMRRVCGPALLRHLPFETTAEVSRFAISKQRRVAVADSASLLRVGLVQGAVRLSRDLGMTHLCAVMERSLLRLMRATAVRFTAIGPAVEYHGIRQPCAAEIAVVLAEMAVAQPALWQLVTEGGALVTARRELLAA